MITPPSFISPNSDTPFDPVNVIFYGNAHVENVASILMRMLKPKWRPAQWSHPMYAEFDDPQENGKTIWRKDALALELVHPPASGTHEFARLLQKLNPTVSNAIQCAGPARLHVRLFQPLAADEKRGGWGHWCVASVHREHFALPGGHIVHGWQGPQLILEQQFLSLGRSVLSGIKKVDLQNAGFYQGYWFNGQASAISLK